MTITVPGMEEISSEFSWKEQLNIADLLLMACANAMLSFCIFFFLVLCLERSRPAVVTFSMYENHLEGSLQHRLQSPWRIRLSDSRGVEYIWEVVFLTCKGDAVLLVCLRAMQPIEWWKSVYTLKGKEALNSANLKKCDLDLMGYCLLIRFPL